MITTYLIKNSEMELFLTSAGAAMQRLKLRNGMEPLLSLAQQDRYITDPSYAGTIIAPVCGRIVNAEISIYSEKFQLSRNEGKHLLHSGSHSTARSVWDIIDGTDTSVQFEIRLPDGLDGFPGNRTVTVSYRLDGKNIVICMACRTDRPTIFNPTTHAYWNFSQWEPITTHTLKIPAQMAYQNNREFIPVAPFPVSGTAFDFTNPVKIAEAIKKDDPFSQIEYGNGYNNGFCSSTAVLNTDRCRMTVKTDAPDIWLYTGGFLDKRTTVNCQLPDRQAATEAFPFCALALEPQDISGPNITDTDGYRTRTVIFSFDF